MKTLLNNEVIRFVIVGGMNTLNYYVLYLLFLHLANFDYLVSHILAFLISMVGSFYMNSYFTYRTKPTLRKFLQFPLTYVVNITVTTVSIYVLVDLLHLDENISPLAASLIAIPFTFLISKRILVNKKDDQQTNKQTTS